MRIRLIIYGFVFALLLDAGAYHGHYLRVMLLNAQYCGNLIGTEVDNQILQPFRNTVLGLHRPNG